jgi:hypothetical protein
MVVIKMHKMYKRCNNKDVKAVIADSFITYIDTQINDLTVALLSEITDSLYKEVELQKRKKKVKRNVKWCK